jgi:photosystem II stability/assembly factor-like uncharacterized protein
MKLLSASLLLVFAMHMPAAGAWVNVTGSLAGKSTQCGGVYCLVAVPKQDKVVIGICGGVGLYATTDNGDSWRPLGASTGWVDPQAVVFDKDKPDVFWECGIHGGQIHKTLDGGKTFTILGGATNNCDGLGIDMTDPQRRTIVAGWHEGSNLQKSTDGGKTWTKITANISGTTSFPVVLDAKTYILAGSGGIWRTTNGGSNWSKVRPEVAGWVPLVASDGCIYFNVNNNQAVLKSADRGLTWTSMAKPGKQGANNYSPVEMPDGSIVAIGQKTLVQCGDGKTWKPIGSPLPSTGLTQGNLAYNSVAGAFYMAFWNCTPTIPAKAIWKQDFAVPASEGKKQR